MNCDPVDKRYSNTADTIEIMDKLKSNVTRNREILLDAVRAVSLVDRMDTRDEITALYATDLAYKSSFIPVAILRPENRKETAVLVAAVTRAGLFLEIRAAGMSYSRGYIPQNDSTVVLDVRALKQLDYAEGCRDIVVVDAGVTFLELDSFLAGSGMKVAIEAPFSGSISTIGASIRQGLTADMSAVLAVEIVTSDGEVFTTGALANDESYSPAWRGQGPNLTELFVGDCGAFGVLTRFWLRLKSVPRHQQFFACTVDDAEQFVAILDGLPETPGDYRGFCFDPAKSAGLKQQSFTEKTRVLRKILGAKRNPRDIFKTGFQMLKTLFEKSNEGANHCWSAHFILEGSSKSEVVGLLSYLAMFTEQHGNKLLATTVAEGLAVKPYSVRGILGRNYERWVPINAIFSLKDRRSVFPVLTDKLSELRENSGVDSLEMSMLLVSVGRHHYMAEPMFLWRSSLYPLHLNTLPNANQLADESDFQSVDELVYIARNKVIEFMGSIGAQHVQLGRVYPYLQRANPVTQRIAKAIKSVVDPRNQIAANTLGINCDD